MYKQNFEEVLEALQQQVFMQYELTEAELERATEYYKDDPEVSSIVAELEALYLGKGSMVNVSSAVVLAFPAKKRSLNVIYLHDTSR